MKIKSKTIVIAAAALGALYFLSKKGGAGAAGGAASDGAPVQLGMQPASIGAGEPVSAQSYRIIQSRRSGMQYTAAQDTGSGISFSFPSGGVFTRNFVQENGVLMAEIAPS